MMNGAIQRRKGPAVPDPFDPYYSWLAIPPEDQPPNHYQLLGLKYSSPMPTSSTWRRIGRWPICERFNAGRTRPPRNGCSTKWPPHGCACGTPRRGPLTTSFCSVPNVAAAAPLEPEAEGEASFDIANLVQPAQGPAKRFAPPAKASKPDGDRRRNPGSARWPSMRLSAVA